MSAIGSLLFFSGAVIFHQPDGLIAGCALFGVGLLVLSLYKLGEADLLVTESSASLLYAFARRSLTLDDLSISDAMVGNRGPVFVLSTNQGTYRIAYTKKNSIELKKLLDFRKATSRVTVLGLEERIKATWWSYLKGR